MSTTPQSYANHTRWQPTFHFFVLPVLLINVIWSVVYCVIHPLWNQGWWIVVSVALVPLAVFTRTNALKAQDRIIRLEERLRYQRVLPAELAQKAAALTEGQMIALRFADDQELDGLVRDVLAGKFAKTSDIKKAIKRWRADEFRV